jgi:hypothetical protein
MSPKELAQELECISEVAYYLKAIATHLGRIEDRLTAITYDGIKIQKDE